MDYTSEQKYEHYLFLQRSLAELKSGRKPTDDWEQEHFNFFVKIRQAFPDFRRVSLDIEDSMYRAKMEDAEMLARYIEMYWEGNGAIEYNAYLQFLQRMLYAFEYTLTDDEISDLMAMMKM
jgi:hypothetical protein